MAGMLLFYPLFLQFFTDFPSFFLHMLPLVSLSVTRINYCSSIVHLLLNYCYNNR